MIFQNSDSIIFAGDSVTDMGKKGQVSDGFMDDLGHGYVHLIDSMLALWYPDRIIRVSNAGVNGDTSRDLLNRFDRDVVSRKPDWVSICIGINDVWRQFDMPSMPEFHVSLNEYQKNLESMADKLDGSVKGIFLCSPYYMEPNPEDRLRARMNEYIAVCEETAKRKGCIYIDFQKAYDEYLQYRHSSFIAWDRVHPNQLGSLLMAKAFLSKCGFEFSDEVRNGRKSKNN